MPQGAAKTLAEAVSDAGHALPGAFGEAATATQFAARWALRNARGVEPVEGILLCEVERVRPRASVAGALRQATVADHDLVVDWLSRFYAEIGHPGRHAQEPVAARLQAGLYWLWLDPEPVSMAGITPAVAGVARVRAAYTPPELRNRGYCAACVGALSERVLDQGQRCILYTDLSNPASNASYRRIGYEPRGVELRFRFLDAEHGT
jgi:predicted GNAT family acetyltransferase